jgi:signal transduction histidine kinase
VEERVLVWAASRDAQLTQTFLTDSGFPSHICRNVDEFRQEFQRGAGAAVIAGEVLDPSVMAQTAAILDTQPPWSDLPVILVVGAELPGEKDQFNALGNVSLLPRPLSLDTLRSTVRSALRARRRQYQVRDLLLEREEADRRKDEFLAMLAHELRNPLAPLMTGLQLLQLQPDPALVRRTHATMERQILNLTRIVDDLLDVSRITRGKIVLKKRVIDMRESLQQAAETVRHLAVNKGLLLDLELPGDALLVSADAVRVEQMLTNLLTNAIKYTPPKGTIWMSARNEAGSIVVSIRDNGVGIAPDQLESVFELFAQTDRGLDRSLGGLGLGLTIVRVLAELHQGSVQLLSDGEGKGTEAVIRLPAAAEALVSDTDGPRKRTHGTRTVLVIEDNADVAEMLAMYLEQLGHRVIVATDGHAGLEAALRNHPDVVVCDIGLPGLNGFQIATRLREDSSFRSCLLIAVTGYGDVADKRRTREAGFTYHVTKPADPNYVAELIATKLN